MLKDKKITLYEAAQIARQCLTSEDDLPDRDFLGELFLKFNGKSSDYNWGKFNEKYDLTDPNTRGILKVVKCFIRLAREDIKKQQED